MAEAPISAQTIELFKQGIGDPSDIVWEKTYTIQTSAGAVYPFLTNASFWWTVKTAYSTDAVLTLTENNGIVVDTSAGTATIQLLRNQTSAISTSIEEQAYVYDFDMRDQNGRLIRIVKGELTVKGDV